MNQRFSMGYTLWIIVDSGKLKNCKYIRMNGSFSCVVIIIQYFAALPVCGLLMSKFLMKQLSLRSPVSAACQKTE
jgi:hypothetical protein